MSIEAVTAQALRTALVKTSERGRVTVMTGETTEDQAVVAASCLLTPEAGDRVALMTIDRESFVVAVLQRGSNGAATLAVLGDGDLVVKAGSVSVEASRSISLVAPDLRLKAGRLSVLAEKATWLGEKLATIVRKVSVSAKRHETSAEHLSEMAGYRTAIVEVADTLRTECQNVTVNGVAVETAHSKVLTVKDDLRMDGTRIAVG